jgi:hypothetical protein
MTVESPFLEGTKLQFAWDSTSLGELKLCPRRYQYTIIEGWRKASENVHFRFGGEYHAALEHYDRLRAEGMAHKDALEETVSTALYRTWEYDEEGLNGAPWQSDHNLKNRATLIRSIVWYLDTFGEADPAKTVILQNGAPAVELSFKFEFTDTHLLCGHLDRVVNLHGDHFVMDRKTTTTTISPHFFEGFSPDNQMSLYTLAAQVIYSTPVKGVIIDGVQVAVGFSRFERGFAYRTPAQLAEWQQDTLLHIRAAERYAEADYWPTNDKSCHNYGGCPFRGICSKDPGVRDKFLESNFVRNPWNPLAVR